MAKTKTLTESTVEEKLKALFKLQQIDSKIDKIKTIRGELPLEVEDLEDELKGLETRINKIKEDISDLDKSVAEKDNTIKDANLLIAKYKKQQDNVRNNREFDSLSKEIEFQGLEIQLAEKRIKEFKVKIAAKEEQIAEADAILQDRMGDLKAKQHELDDIVNETKKEEEELTSLSQENELIIEDRLLTAYKRIRSNARNGLAVVSVERNSCGGCFNNIPPQRQLDISSRKKIIVCEYCGRILVDPEISKEISID